LQFRIEQFLDRRVALAHEPILAKLPILVAIGAKPVPKIIMLFVGKAHGDSISGKSL